MQCGDILGFVTKQAPNHPHRYKYHLYLCLAPHESDTHIFMLISSRGTEQCLKIDQSDWPDMPKNHSYINFQKFYKYNNQKIKNAELKGRLSNEALKKLMDHAEDSKTLTPDEIDIIIDALSGYLDP